ncbi:hypothetical protein [Paraconexibacter sp. AEG42_29]
MNFTRPARRAALGLLTLGLLALPAAPAPAAAAAAAAKAKPKIVCPKHSGELVVRQGSGGVQRVWHDKDSLYTCSTRQPYRSATLRLGPWGPGSRVALSGNLVGWTVPTRAGGATVDRIHWGQTNLRNTLLRGVKAAKTGSGSGTGRDARVTRLVAFADALAWVTADGGVYGALPLADDAPEAIGAPLAPFGVFDGRVFALGTYADVPNAELARSLRITVKRGDENVECVYVDDYRFTVDVGGSVVGGTARSGRHAPCPF